MSTINKPNVLIFGGLNFYTTVLAQHLVPPLPAEPLISHLRMVDKYLVDPPTTCLSKGFLKTIRERGDLIEYRQGNLSIPAVVSKSFTDPAPNGLPYTHIIDATGDYIADRPVEIYIRNVFDIALLIARASAAQLARAPGSIKAHIRVALPFYENPDYKKRYKEADAEGWKVKALRPVWWHETLRAIGNIPGLPLVVLRTALVYGEGYGRFEGVALILLGLVYKHLGREMKLLWSPELPKSSINTHDFSGLVWKAAEWVSNKTRKEADALAGVPLPPSYHPSVTSSACPDALLASAGSVVVPTFNAVDEGDSTQASMSDVISRVFGIKVGFLNSSGGLPDGMTLREVIQEASEVHLEAWGDIIMHSKPPVLDTPLSPYMPPTLIEEHACAMDGEKIKRILGYKFRYPRFDERAVRDYINWCRAEGIWPETDLYTGV